MTPAIRITVPVSLLTGNEEAPEEQTKVFYGSPISGIDPDASTTFTFSS